MQGELFRSTHFLGQSCDEYMNSGSICRIQPCILTTSGGVSGQSKSRFSNGFSMPIDLKKSYFVQGSSKDRDGEGVCDWM